jgi:hypothetical protein
MSTEDAQTTGRVQPRRRPRWILSGSPLSAPVVWRPPWPVRCGLLPSRWRARYDATRPRLRGDSGASVCVPDHAIGEAAGGWTGSAGRSLLGWEGSSRLGQWRLGWLRVRSGALGLSRVRCRWWPGPVGVCPSGQVGPISQASANATGHGRSVGRSDSGRVRISQVVTYRGM